MSGLRTCVSDTGTNWYWKGKLLTSERVRQTWELRDMKVNYLLYINEGIKFKGTKLNKCASKLLSNQRM